MNRHPFGQAVRGLAAFLVLHFASAGIACAGSFSVNPVRVTLSPKQPVAAITVRNAGTEPTVVQLEMTAWSQEQGQDVLEASNDLLATPPIFTLQPGGTQIVRVGSRQKSAASRELTYRLVLREVPPATPPAQGLRVALTISMPVFVVPQTTVSPSLEWSATRTSDGKVRVQATNTGNAHVQLATLDLVADGTTIGTRKIAEYVLPGNTRSWMVDTHATPPAGATLHIDTRTDAGKFRSDVALEIDVAGGAGTPASSKHAR